MNFTLLKQQENLKINEIRSEFTLRIHRAISWGLHADNSVSMDDKFIFYWIAFNAIYGVDNKEDFVCELNAIYKLLEKVCELDKEDSFKNVLAELSNSIRILLNNEFLYKEFWKSRDGEVSIKVFERAKANALRNTYESLANKSDQMESLYNIFELLYLLRNQIFHGSSTFGGKLNREQLRCSVAIMERIMPLIVECVYTNRDVDWGKVSYPVVNA